MFDLLLKRNKLFADPKRLGRWGERRCEKFLKSTGCTMLARNFTCRTGELDLVMADTDGTIVFVEVKTRTDEDFTDTEDVITFAKKQKLRKAARYFLKTHRIEDRPCRFDFVTIVVPRKGPAQIRHYPHAMTG